MVDGVVRETTGQSINEASVVGLSVKASCRVATAAALPSNLYVNGVLTAVGTGVLTVDGVAVALNDRILVKDEATAANNGIYVCTVAGALGVGYVLTRASDMNESAEFPGAFAAVLVGTANAQTVWICLADPDTPFVVGTTACNWTELISATGATSVPKSLYDANTILKADTDDTPVALTMGASTILARLAAGSIVAATPAQLKTLLAVVAADISDFNTAVATTAVLKTLYDANTVLIATTDDTPTALTMGASTILARLAAGNIVAATPVQLKTLLAIAESDVTNLTTDLAAKIPLSTVTAADDLIIGSGNATVTNLAVAASRIIGKKASGGTSALTATEAKAILAIAESDVTNLVSDLAAKAPSTGIAESAVTNLVSDLAAKTPRASTATYFQRKMRTSGNITCNGTNWADLDTGLDLVLTATTGDVVEVAISFSWSNEAVIGCLDVSSIVSGSPVNCWSQNAAEDNTKDGVMGWVGPVSLISYRHGSVCRALTAGDISAGTVTLRFRVRTITAANKTFFATVPDSVIVWAINHG